MGTHGIDPRPRTSQPGKEHRIYPFRLRNLTIDCPDQAWATDITDNPMRKGFQYLVAIMDWYRCVLSWKKGPLLRFSGNGQSQPTRSNSARSLRQVVRNSSEITFT